MEMKEFYELCKSGVTPLIKMKNNIHDFLEESFDPGMIGRVIDVSVEYEDSYRLLIDMNGHEKHNKSVAVYNWRDDKGELTKSWFDTKYYPEDGIEAAYFPMTGETPFEVVRENSLFASYLKNGEDKSYVEWLEDYIEWFENKIAAEAIAEAESFNHRENVDISHKVEKVSLPVSYGGRLPTRKER